MGVYSLDVVRLAIGVHGGLPAEGQVTPGVGPGLWGREPGGRPGQVAAT